MRKLLTILSLVIPAALGAQGAPSGFAVTTRVDSIEVRGETIRLGLSVENARTSPVELWGIIVDAPSPVTRQEAPALTPGIPDADWFRQTIRAGQSVSEWLVIADVAFAPGTRTPTLWYEASGLPGLVTYRAVAYLPPPQTQNPDEEAPIDPVTRKSILGTTVGIVPAPSGSDAAPAALATRLLDLQGRSCALGWITQQGVCHSLEVKLQHAGAALAAGTLEEARGDLQAFINELDAQNGKFVTTTAYALLRPNAQYLLARL